MKVGDRIKLKANEEEGWPEQKATYLGVSGGALLVQVDYEDHCNLYDDGLREVTADQIEVLP